MSAISTCTFCDQEERLEDLARERELARLSDLLDRVKSEFSQSNFDAVENTATRIAISSVILQSLMGQRRTSLVRFCQEHRRFIRGETERGCRPGQPGGAGETR